VVKSVATRTALAARLCDDADMSKTVLIVDDHPSFRAMARALLESEGFTVVGEAADGESAVEQARTLRPDVVLLDVQLPDIDGFQVAARLTANGSSPDIVMTSSRDSFDFGSLIAQCGARGFVPKAEISAEAIAALLR
jgi:DNA-binding NarL/FixJ family response regulator